MEKIRIHKYLADCGIMSRRAAEIEIAGGKVLVNDICAEIGQIIDPEIDVVKYNNAIVKPKTDKKIYVMLNKPIGYVTTLSDEKGRKCITELISDIGERIYPVGRLDLDSEGLLLLTNDGELANKLMHPKHNIPKIYNVLIAAKITPEQLKILNDPMLIDGYMIKPVRTEVIGDVILKMTLFEGRNRQIRKMCEIANIKIIKLRRVAIGKIKLEGLQLGKWKYLTPEQINYLLKE
ncbi:MAG: rRNA pseudouridine synthase [Oscillospiraceae bacterium]|nr:rRNA pseudouridine synthase [Oscillospiraceae bacterium]